MIYHPGHKSKPVLTHIATIGSDYFIADDSCTDRMIPIRHAQRTLKFKLTLSDVEREVDGISLDPGERVLWRRWFEDENTRMLGKRRVSAPCCGRSVQQYKLEAHGPHLLCCSRCKSGDWGGASDETYKQKASWQLAAWLRSQNMPQPEPVALTATWLYQPAPPQHSHPPNQPVGETTACQSVKTPQPAAETAMWQHVQMPQPVTLPVAGTPAWQSAQTPQPAAETAAAWQSAQMLPHPEPMAKPVARPHEQDISGQDLAMAVQTMPQQSEQGCSQSHAAQDSQSAHTEPATDSEVQPQVSMAPTDGKAKTCPLPTPVGSPVPLGPNPNEAPAVTATKVIPPWRRQKVEEEYPPLKRQRPNGILELWHPYKAAVFFQPAAPCYLNLGKYQVIGLCRMCDIPSLSQK